MDEGASLSLPTKEHVLKIQTDAEVDVLGYYYDEKLAQVGEGPHPPVAGKTTSYQMVLKITNTTSDLENISVSAKLPDNVSWYGEHSVNMGNDLNYDPKTKLVTWQLDKVIANSGELFTTAEAIFKVSLTPKTSDVGKAVKLIQDVKLQATDTFTQTVVNSTDAEITTALPDDELSSGTGKVKASTSSSSNTNSNTNN